MRRWLGSLLLASLLCAGCAAPKAPKAAPPKPAAPQAKDAPGLHSNTDPCAMRLHETAGALLLYFASHHDLPATLEDLKKSPGAQEAGDFTCPVSHEPYVYVPAGIPAPDPAARLVLYDPQPSHSGMRWAVAVLPPEGNGPLVAKVVAVRESHFANLPPATRP